MLNNQLNLGLSVRNSKTLIDLQQEACTIKNKYNQGNSEKV